MPVADWFPDFFLAHQARTSFFPWPTPDSVEYELLVDTWERAMVRCGATAAVADEASARIAAESVAWEKHLPRLVEIVGEVFRESVVDSGPSSQAATRDAAERDSRGCVECEGTGWARRYRHHARRDGVGRDAAGFCVLFYCNLCPMGRFTKAAHEAARSKGAAIPPVPDLRDFPALHLRECGHGRLDNPHCHRAENWDFLNDVPDAGDPDAWRRDLAGRAGVVAVRDVLAARPIFTPAPAPAPAADDAEGVVPDEFVAAGDEDWTRNP